ncbi:hypothetical protein Acr_09g0001750 [Actinidia rufa]|uniref:Uncharacterized protein n=1 Tax=Actinidia rufa TaxID=165716 RepID=A0A7J0F6A6_9ERIC|nr:hypothetical protein Acr_09g0001750 [Actinidia rufa]
MPKTNVLLDPLFENRALKGLILCATSNCTRVVTILGTNIIGLVATGLAIAANQSSFQRTRKLKETVLGAGEDARKTIRKVTEAMNQMQKLLLPYDPKTCDLLNSTSRQLGRESRVIRNFDRKNERSINKAIQIS